MGNTAVVLMRDDRGLDGHRSSEAAQSPRQHRLALLSHRNPAKATKPRQGTRPHPGPGCWRGRAQTLMNGTRDSETPVSFSA